MEDGMEILLSAWFGALAGTIVAVAVYVPAMRAVERHLHEKRGPTPLGQRAAFEEKLSVVRRLVLGACIAILATLGYWIGGVIGGGMRG
jgi:hypothetical protein